MQHPDKIVAEVLESVRLDHRTSFRHRSSELNSSRMTNYDEFNQKPSKIIKTMDRFNECSKCLLYPLL